MTGQTHNHLRNRFLRTTLHGLTPALLAVLMAGSAAAQDSSGPDSGPPALVGRIAAISGAVSMQRADAQDWVDAGINEPISIGDAVYATEGADARRCRSAPPIWISSPTVRSISPRWTMMPAQFGWTAAASTFGSPTCRPPTACRLRRRAAPSG